jgi:hypothetical protein
LSVLSLINGVPIGVYINSAKINPANHEEQRWILQDNNTRLNVRTPARGGNLGYGRPSILRLKIARDFRLPHEQIDLHSVIQSVVRLKR